MEIKKSKSKKVELEEPLKIVFPPKRVNFETVIKEFILFKLQIFIILERDKDIDSEIKNKISWIKAVM
jgi:hypothetical protein